MAKRQEKTSRDDGYVYYLVCGDGFAAVYLC